MWPPESAHTRFMHGTAKSRSPSTSSRPLVAWPTSIPPPLGRRPAVGGPVLNPRRARPRLAQRRPGERQRVGAGGGERAVDDRAVVGLPDFERPRPASAAAQRVAGG